MLDDLSVIIYLIFTCRLLARSGDIKTAYIKGQLDEAYHQLALGNKKQKYGEHHEL